MKKGNPFYNLILLLLLFLSSHGIAQKTIIKNGDSWEYYDIGYLDEEWMLHPDSYKWKKGKTPIGYGDETVITNINYGTSEDNKHLLKYFKKEFYITDTNFLGYEFRILRDDGAVVYVNGKELFRSNMQNATITNTSLAKKTVDGNTEEKFFIKIFENSIFKKGKNVITVSIHQAYKESSDCIFSLELIGHDSTEILNRLVSSKNESNEELKKNIEELKTKFEYEKLYNKSEGLENANYSLKVLVLIIVILFVLTLVIIYSLIDNKRVQSKEHAEKSLRLKETILGKEKEMLILNTKILKSKQYFKEIKADLKGIKIEDKSTLKMIISDIDEILVNNDEWISLQNHFNAVYDGYYDKLLSLHPDLTETELRHCIFIKLHLQTKEIARILLIDPRSVQTARYRIKKKMKLTEDVDIRDYLLNI
jgi:DNA-binding CsgD family transcriptional regulator